MIHPALAAFCDRLDAMPADARTALIATDAIHAGGLVTIDLAGIRATGQTRTAAAENWRVAARTRAGGYPMPAHDDPDLACLQRAWAMRVVNAPDRAIPDATVARACRILLDLTADHALQARAKALLRALRPHSAALAAQTRGDHAQP